MAKVPGFLLQVFALPLSYYLKHQDAIPWEIVENCNTLTFQEEGLRHRESVLHGKEGGTLEADGFVSFPSALDSGKKVEYHAITSPQGIQLPEVFFARRSGESLLDGKQPQIVLMVRAVTARSGVPISNIKPAVSSPFCVATRRVKGAMKVDIPSMDQEVRVLVHIGDACIRKLHELHKHVYDGSGVVVPAGCREVRTVEQLAAVMAANRNNQAAEKRLFQGILNMNEEKWRELQKQISKAVKPDSALRVFYCGIYQHPPVPNILEGPVDMGLVFSCNRGSLEFKESSIVGVVMRSRYSNREAIVPWDMLSHEQQLLPTLFMHARNAWFLTNHPGWGIYKYEGKACAEMPKTKAPYTTDWLHVPCFTPEDHPATSLIKKDSPNEANTGLIRTESVTAAPANPDPPREADFPAVSLIDTSAAASNWLSQANFANASLPDLLASMPSNDDLARSVFENSNLGNMQHVPNLSSIFASAMCLPLESSAINAPVADWMDTSNMLRIGNTLRQQVPSPAQPQATSHHPPSDFSSIAASVFASARPEEGGGLRRPRSSTLDSQAFDVARSDRQRLRADDTCAHSDRGFSERGGALGISEAGLQSFSSKLPSLSSLLPLVSRSGLVPPSTHELSTLEALEFIAAAASAGTLPLAGLSDKELPFNHNMDTND